MHFLSRYTNVLQERLASNTELVDKVVSASEEFKVNQTPCIFVSSPFFVQVKFSASSDRMAEGTVVPSLSKLHDHVVRDDTATQETLDSMKGQVSYQLLVDEQY